MITSVHNPAIQTVRKLLTQAKARREQKTFVIEGVRLAEEALQAAWETILVLYTDELDRRGKTVLDGYAARGVAIEQVSGEVMKSLSETETPQGLLAVLAQKNLSLPASPDFLLILDGVRDPGNMGTILRTSAAAGVQVVILTSGCVDAWSPKVVRAGMGAHFRLPIFSMSWQEILPILKEPDNPITIYLADSSGGISYSGVDFKSRLTLIVGGEAAGASSTAITLADMKVHIPMPGGSESLNAAVAASILLFEVVRQRGVEIS